jgi:hypothetical protein
VLKQRKTVNKRQSSSQGAQGSRRRGAVIAGFACLSAGLLLMTWLPWRPLPYLSLFVIALILSVVAVAQKRVWSGLTLVLLTISAPPALFLLGIAGPQVADTTFHPPIERPAYGAGQGPTVLVDEAHSNFHTATGRYLPFADLLRRDGYVVKSSAARFTAKVLGAGIVLVVANAVAVPAADEVAAVREWVAGGGSLLLIADHEPFNVGAKALGKAFGVRFADGAAVVPNDQSFRLVFRRSDGTLKEHPITRGIDAVATFYGCSFQMDAAGQPLLVFGPSVYVRQKKGASPRSLDGHLQGAVLPFGNGRVAAFGEAAMFTAQLADLDRHAMGMNAPIARENPQFLLNVMHWLTRTI